MTAPRGDQAVDGTSSMTDGGPVALEFLIEPFVEAAPGPHVLEGIEALVQAGLAVEPGPFATVATGDLDAVTAALGPMVARAVAAGATSIRIHIGREANDLAVAPLQDALDTMIRSLERDLDKPVAEWTRSDKQAAVRHLDDNGAFLLRGAVDDIAGIMGVSRITIYNYLNAIDRHEIVRDPGSDLDPESDRRVDERADDDDHRPDR